MTETIKPALTAYLNRKSPPARLKGEQAMADEARALLHAMHRAAPTKHPSAEWAEDFLGQIERRERAPVWPSVADIERLGVERRKDQPGEKVEVKARPRDAVFAKRIMAGEPVSEFDLWGHPAIAAVRFHGTPGDAIAERRAQVLAERASLYGQDKADAFATDMRARWEHARATFGQPTAKTVDPARRAELVAWARTATRWERVEDSPEARQPARYAPTAEDLEAARAANPIVQSIRAAQAHQRKDTAA